MKRAEAMSDIQTEAESSGQNRKYVLIIAGVKAEVLNL